MPAEQEGVLVDHGLHDVLEVGPRHLEAAHVRELHRQERRPPADGQVLTVHRVQFGVVRNSVNILLVLIVAFVYFFRFNGIIL